MTPHTRAPDRPPGPPPITGAAPRAPGAASPSPPTTSPSGRYAS